MRISTVREGLPGLLEALQLWPMHATQRCESATPR